MEIHGSDDANCEDITITLQERIKFLPQYSARRCIYRVPNLLRQTNEQAYTPLLVSIGPLHHNDARFHPMEARKLKYLQSFLNESRTNVDLNYYIGMVKGMEAQIRECYADPIHFSSNDFTQMVLTDSVFIIELFRKWNCHSKVEDDSMYGRPHFINEGVLRDLKLEENQLPFFVLQRLYRIAFKTQEHSHVPSFTEIACNALNVNKSNINVDATNEASCLHLVDLLLGQYKPSTSMLRVSHDHVSIDIDKSLVCPTATNLYEAGVKLQMVSCDRYSSNLPDICFDADKGILKIPRLRVMDHTEDLFRNLIAFEQCHCDPQETCIIDYQCFLNWLIDTSEDVRLLVKAGIIENWLGSNNEVCELFNSLDHNVNLSERYYNYLGITHQLNTHCNKRWNRYRATLNHTYFKHPWAAISVIYAIVLLILTVMQVFAGFMAIPKKM